VKMMMKHRLLSWQSGSRQVLHFSAPQGEVRVEADAVILALGGASWSITGSDGKWTEMFSGNGVTVRPWQAANCGWEVDWPSSLIPRIEGLPLKNMAASAGGRRVVGELMLTRYGIEGGIIYQLGPELRAMQEPEFSLDCKPDQSEADLLRKIESVKKNIVDESAKRWRLSPPAHALLEWAVERDEITDPIAIARLTKHLPIRLLRPRPIDEAISSAGGVAWSGLNDDLSLRAAPGLFVAGEMIDWEAPTGGYLMQGCFASGRRAAMGALAFCEKARSMQP
jgi:uncharacterized flavoprotein (TIGR03862 family)